MDRPVESSHFKRRETAIPTRSAEQQHKGYILKAQQNSIFLVTQSGRKAAFHPFAGHGTQEVDTLDNT